jgi:uncharacterized protein YndB with AHSA1/START domain
MPRMRSVTATCAIDAPREEVFEYLSDLANHVEFTDHYLKDFRLERLESRGLGAAASFRVAFPLASIWAEAVVTELERPYRIILEGGAGRLYRIKTKAVFTLSSYDHEMTRVEYTFSTVPATRFDAVREALGRRTWISYQSRRALRRLKHLLEQGEPSAHAVRVAAG